jgi:hypothetical protein
MAEFETRGFGSTKHLLVMVDKDEAELLNVLGNDRPMAVCGFIKLADGWGAPYIELQKGVKNEAQVKDDTIRNVRKILKRARTLAKKTEGTSVIRKAELGLKAFELLAEMNEIMAEMDETG